ncbi:hypothetical protein [Streptomyces sp. NPDC007172]|uniref:hypothetical protein n=1 Tax=Streptomyces sp. NPDC007172 TaxID=3364776 RepID=UPI00369C2256
MVVGDPVWSLGADGPLASGDGSSVQIRSIRDAEVLAARDADRLAFVVAPGSASVRVAGLLAALRSRFPRLRGQHPDQWCYTMSDLLISAWSVLAESEVLLLAGTPDSPATAAAQAAAAHMPVHRFTTLAQFRPHHIDVATLAVTDSGTRLGGQLLQVLAGLGPLDVMRRNTRTESVPVLSPLGGGQASRALS